MRMIHPRKQFATFHCMVGVGMIHQVTSLAATTHRQTATAPCRSSCRPCPSSMSTPPSIPRYPGVAQAAVVVATSSSESYQEVQDEHTSFEQHLLSSVSDRNHDFVQRLLKIKDKDNVDEPILVKTSGFYSSASLFLNRALSRGTAASSGVWQKALRFALGGASIAALLFTLGTLLSGTGSSPVVIKTMATLAPSSTLFFNGGGGGGGAKLLSMFLVLPPSSEQVASFIREKFVPASWNALQTMLLMEFWRRIWTTVGRASGQWLETAAPRAWVSLKNFWEYLLGEDATLFRRGVPTLFRKCIERRVQSTAYTWFRESPLHIW
eukprot:CAMPEP_0198281414 /NCGR_PEP_ID=MMETSP1449-20131203/1363_1 /TAXON_ID=420275 /ORGANISM="Attheya septentrionalis, Strain CCMP2084" /LENGTH=322 /DNA_ID=CAMNT_0043977183 /DNA_START=115 /DNA_END=1080 /DNA_ORIENTATION=+